MNKPHKHREIIKAWADGAEIQFFNNFKKAWEGIPEPVWSDEVQYRVKPQTIRYKVGLQKTSDGFDTLTAATEEHASYIEKYPDFIRWITDWIKVEV